MLKNIIIKRNRLIIKINLKSIFELLYLYIQKLKFIIINNLIYNVEGLLINIFM